MIEAWDERWQTWGIRQPLSDGNDLVLMVSDVNYQDLWFVELIVVEPDEDITKLSETDYEDYWRVKAGRAIGPGGLEVWGYAGEMLRRAEAAILRQDSLETPIIGVGAATETLHKIYGKVLPRFGYTQVAGEYLKMLESK